MLQQRNIDVDIVLYLKTKPDAAELRGIAAKLEDPVADLVRRDKFFKETILGEQGLDVATLDDPEVTISLLEKYPKLLQRPIIVTADTAIIGRPRDRVPALFD